MMRSTIQSAKKASEMNEEEGESEAIFNAKKQKAVAMEIVITWLHSIAPPTFRFALQKLLYLFMMMAVFKVMRKTLKPRFIKSRLSNNGGLKNCLSRSTDKHLGVLLSWSMGIAH